MSESDSNKNIFVKYVRDNSSKIVSMMQGSNTYYLVYDGTGNVTAVTDSSGSEVASYSYDEFGNINASTGEVYNPIKYQGENNAYYDEETGLYKIGLRYYDLKVGRWLTRDPEKDPNKYEPNSRHKYAYSENDPINKYDSSGLSASSRGLKKVRFYIALSLYDLPNHFIRMNYFRQIHNITFKRNKAVKNSASTTSLCFKWSGWWHVQQPTKVWRKYHKRQAWAQSDSTFFNYSVPPGLWKNHYVTRTLITNTGKFGIRTKKTYRLTTPKWTSLWNATIRVNGALKWHKNIERVRGDGDSFFNDETGSGDVF